MNRGPCFALEKCFPRNVDERFVTDWSDRCTRMASGYVPNITVELKWKGQVLKHKFSGNSTVGEVKQHAIDAFDLESSSIKLLGLGKGKAIADNVCASCL